MHTSGSTAASVRFLQHKPEWAKHSAPALGITWHLVLLEETVGIPGNFPVASADTEVLYHETVVTDRRHLVGGLWTSCLVIPSCSRVVGPVGPLGFCERHGGGLET